MKALLDFLPAIAFFIGFKLGDIYLATKIGIGVTLLTVLFMKFTKQKVTPLLWMSLIVIVVFGGLTIALHDENFIKWKPTVLYSLAASALLLWLFGFKKNLLQWLLGAQLQLPQPVWNRLAQMWAGMFYLLAAGNAFVALHFPTEVWVSWRTFGITGALLAFTIIVAIYLSKHLKTEIKDA
ncbi:MAG: septation protein A [Burkholderiaceae bacterium]|nr:septation protein A [Burkholderiaceae bacterium]